MGDIQYDDPRDLSILNKQHDNDTVSIHGTPKVSIRNRDLFNIDNDIDSISQLYISTSSLKNTQSRLPSDKDESNNNALWDIDDENSITANPAFFQEDTEIENREDAITADSQANLKLPKGAAEIMESELFKSDEEDNKFTDASTQKNNKNPTHIDTKLRKEEKTKNPRTITDIIELKTNHNIISNLPTDGNPPLAPKLINKPPTINNKPATLNNKPATLNNKATVNNNKATVNNNNKPATINNKSTENANNTSNNENTASYAELDDLYEDVTTEQVNHTSAGVRSNINILDNNNQRETIANNTTKGVFGLNGYENINKSRINLQDKIIIQQEKLAPQIRYKIKVLRGPRGYRGKSIRGPRGERGPSGSNGEKGKPGIRGAKGEKGEKGEKGDRGARGEKGNPGRPGDSGEIGDKGDTGEKGDKGEPGVKGEKGERGDKGEHGEKGETGAKGEDGKLIVKDSDIRISELVNFDLSAASSTGEKQVSNQTILMMDLGIEKSVVSFNNTGNGINQVIINTTGMRRPVQSIKATINYQRSHSFVTLNPTIKKSLDANIFEIVFQLVNKVDGVGHLTIIFT